MTNKPNDQKKIPTINDRSFVEIIGVGVLIHFIIPAIISAIIHFTTHLGHPSIAILLCLGSLFLFILMLRLWGVFYLIKAILSIIPGLIRLLRGKKFNKHHKEDNLDEADDDERFLNKKFLPTHLFCTLSLFFVTSHWIYQGKAWQVLVYLVMATVYSLIVFWAERNGYLDYLERGDSSV